MTQLEIHDRIREIIIQWTPDIQALSNQKEIIALNFGFQKVWDGFELCLSGHSWYDEHDLWLLGEEWSPRQNYISLGKDSLEYDRLEIYGIYRKIVQDEINLNRALYDKLQRVVVRPNDGDPEIVK